MGGDGVRRLEIRQRRCRKARRAVLRGSTAAHHDAAHRRQLLPPGEFEPVAEAFVDPVGRKAADGLERHDARQRAIIRSEEHTSELQSLMRISYAVFCLKKKKLKTVTSKHT